MTKINDGEPSRRVRQRAACARLVASAVWFATPLPLLVNWIGPAEAEAESRVVANPPLLEIQQGTAPKSTLMALPNASRLSTEKQLDLDIVYTDSKIYNPGTGRDDKLRLRSYTGTSINPNAPYVAPTIAVDPGDTVRITLHNKLPADPSCTAMTEDPDTPHWFNGTNLHSHGLWVRPTGRGDNVLLSINPGVSFQYEYNIPPDHPAGTFWYHSHRHGSTALQVVEWHGGGVDYSRRPAAGDRRPWRRHRHAAEESRRQRHDRTRACVAADPICLSRCQRRYQGREGRGRRCDRLGV
jgi:FtsP/CotA-like multicopper oxidase with cupredoxin domain